MSSVTGAETQVFALPDSELVFGLCADRRHAVTREMALRAADVGSLRDTATGAVCGQIVHVAPKWGPYEPDSKYVQRGHVCESCAWVVAAARDELPAKIASVAPSEHNRDLVAAAVGDPLLGVRLLEAIAADDELGRPSPNWYHRSHRTDLLAYAAQHLPQVVICEECLDCGSDERYEACGCAAALCTTCTLSSGPWAGEWEGYTLQECLVAAPCSVLRALCTHYEIPHASVGQGHQGPVIEGAS
ncbi:hypothetical protein [Mycobacterium sp.]|uniref:hypothetical protein n=1 Tax=Mycobacterium sp. TaxID=1785 RepID=UPI0025FF980C|nr:hypothetical protein [Mycobacterium sp.]